MAQKKQVTCKECSTNVCNMGAGPIESLSYSEFTEQIEPITLAELGDRFAEELKGLAEEEDGAAEEE